tara:strand:- start:4741 stop:5418 length:678 start_codon:yes stop_codon:yes gene_type:complete
MKNYSYVLEFDTNLKVAPDLLNKALDYAWRYTPSKNNFMNYNVHVLGPNNENLRNSLYEKCLAQQMRSNNETFESLEEYDEYLDRENLTPNFRNIKGAPYIMIYTQRTVTKTNPFQKYLMKSGMVYEQTFEKGTRKYEAANGSARIEVGMFSANFSTKALKLGLAVSYIGCMPTDLIYWQEKEWNFIKDKPMFIQLVGYGKKYKRDEINPQWDLKPDFTDVVNIL